MRSRCSRARTRLRFRSRCSSSIGIRSIDRAASAPFRYLGRMLWPVNLTPLDPLPISPTVDILRLSLAIAAFAALAATAWRLRRQWPALGLGCLAYVAMLAPVAGLTPSGLQATADRYAYMPGVIVWILVGVAMAYIATMRVRSHVVAVIVAALVAAAGVTAFRQIAYWHD